MITLLSRILTYLNGTLFYDDYYRFCLFVIDHYIDMDEIPLDTLIGKTRIKKVDILSFCKLLGFDSYEIFQQYLTQTHVMRLDQIRARMIDINSNILIQAMEKEVSEEVMTRKLSSICDLLFKARRIVIFGAQYPLSISVEFQTDMISFGKPCIHHHSYDPMPLTKDDVAIVISGTGRYIQDFNKNKENVQLLKAQTILITQNKIYEKKEHQLAGQTIVVPGKFDGINFNYQLMLIFDVLRVHYYQQYYL